MATDTSSLTAPQNSGFNLGGLLGQVTQTGLDLIRRNNNLTPTQQAQQNGNLAQGSAIPWKPVLIGAAVLIAGLFLFKMLKK